jgi:hypothetical protein
MSQGSDSTSDDEDHSKNHKVRQTSQRQKKRDQVSELTQRVGELQNTIKSLLMQFEKLQSVKQKEVSSLPRSPARSRSPSPSNCKCNICEGKGHFARECPTKRGTNKQAVAKQVSFSNLNENGSGPQA